MSETKLGNFLKEVSNWHWDEFVQAEKDKQYTSNQAMIFGLVRSCAMQKMDAIKLSLNRLDGKLKTPIKVEYPKMFFLYPHATAIEGGAPIARLGGAIASEVMATTTTTVAPEQDLPSMTLRETLSTMSDYPRELPEMIVGLALQTEQALRGQSPMPDEIPLVKSVVAAHLLIMAQKRNMEALYEVFDQIDGKLVETLQLMGEDVYITSFATVAPPGAYLNDQGILQLEAQQTETQWAAKLSEKL